MIIFQTALFLTIVASCLSQAGKGPAVDPREITIVTQPNAAVWIDGVRFGTTDKKGELTIKTLASAAHSVRVRSDGFKERTQTLTAQQKGTVKITLTPTTDEAELGFQDAERLISVDRDRSAEAYRKAIKLRPNYPEAYIGLARVLSDAGDYDGAKKAIASARKLRPGYAEASAVEGRIYKDDGDEAKAIATFKKAITEGRGFQPEAYAGLGLLFKEKAEAAAGSGDFQSEADNYSEAAKNLKMAVKQLAGAPDSMVIYQLLGLIYERQKKFDDAIAVYEEFLRIFPNSAEATAVRSFIVQLKKGTP